MKKLSIFVAIFILASLLSACPAPLPAPPPTTGPTVSQAQAEAQAPDEAQKESPAKAQSEAPAETETVAAPPAAEAPKPSGEVNLLMLTGDPNDPNWKFQFEMIEEFNKEYAGAYKITYEFGGTQSMDRLEKLKMLNSSKNLPAIVTQLQEDTGFTTLLMQNNRLMDIKPWFDNESVNLKKYALSEQVANIITSSGGGAMYTVPLYNERYIGLFYNMELLSKAGYESFPGDWDGFWKLCADLKAAGITPIAMDTLESAWCSMLISTSVLGADQGGRDFMNALFPTDFNNEYMHRTFDVLKRLFDDYTTADASGAPYSVAANNFCSEKTAMIANGPWMIEQFSDTSYAPEGFPDKVGYACYPNYTMIVESGVTGSEGISVDVRPEEQRAALAWYEFRARPENIERETVMTGAFNPAVSIPDEKIAENGPVYLEYAKAVRNVKYALPCYQSRWDGVTMYEVFAVQLPEYVTGRISTDDLLKLMSESAAKYVAELEQNQ